VSPWLRRRCPWGHPVPERAYGLPCAKFSPIAGGPSYRCRLFGLTRPLVDSEGPMKRRSLVALLFLMTTLRTGADYESDRHALIEKAQSRQEVS
jgi:hypothetical protein